MREGILQNIVQTPEKMETPHIGDLLSVDQTEGLVGPTIPGKMIGEGQVTDLQHPQK